MIPVADYLVHTCVSVSIGLCPFFLQTLSYGILKVFLNFACIFPNTVHKYVQSISSHKCIQCKHLICDLNICIT